MRINLVCPYSEKDIAKSLGARWDAARKTWYIVDVEDLTPFIRWIPKAKSKPEEKPSQSQGDSISLKDFLNQHYGKAISLTYKSAKAFGIPYPLESGWAKKYAHRTAALSSLTTGKSSKKKKQKYVGNVAKPETKVFKPLCHCSVPPWEDCEHTDALAQAAMNEILSGAVT